MNKLIIFSLPAADKEQLVATARQQGRTLSEVMRRSIAPIIAEQRSEITREKRKRKISPQEHLEVN